MTAPDTAPRRVHVLDEWFGTEVKPRLRGECTLVRFADTTGGRAERIRVTADAEALATEAAPAGAAAPNTGAGPRRRPPAAETKRLYAADWAAFEAWCDVAGQPALPADATTVAGFLQEAAATSSAGTLARRVSAIAHMHRQRGFAVPARDPAVKAVLHAARSGASRRRAPPPSPSQLVRMAAACPGHRRGVRDRALLLLLAASGLRHGTLLGLDAEDLHFTATAVALTLDQAGAGGAGGYRSPGYMNNLARLVSVRPLREFPLVIYVSTSKRATLS
jgi:integrase